MNEIPVPNDVRFNMNIPRMSSAEEILTQHDLLGQRAKILHDQENLINQNRANENRRLEGILQNAVQHYKAHFGSDIPSNLPQLWLVSAKTRHSVHVSMIREAEERLKQNPIPTPEEIKRGYVVEQIEPQVRSAIRILQDKGYHTWNSGFFLGGPGQMIHFGDKDGNFQPPTFNLQVQPRWIKKYN